MLFDLRFVSKAIIKVINILKNLQQSHDSSDFVKCSYPKASLKEN